MRQRRSPAGVPGIEERYDNQGVTACLGEMPSNGIDIAFIMAKSMN